VGGGEGGVGVVGVAGAGGEGGFDEGPGFGAVGAGRGRGTETTGAEISPVAASRGRGAGRFTTRSVTAGPLGCVRCPGGIRTTGDSGAGSITRGVAEVRTSCGEVDSKAARQRYPEVTPAATSAQSRSASNEIRTRMSIGPMPDSIGANFRLR
jgi:hypothetical protein